ncbi:MAG: hypothetical protein ACXVJO_15660 [Thermoanaerobaculia bacterium]
MAVVKRARGEIASRADLFGLAGKVALQVPLVLAFYDDQTGLREAVVLSGAEEARHFGAGDERWSLLDEEGNAQSGVGISLSALDGREGEVTVSAIDLALAEIGADKTSSTSLQRIARSAA